MKPNKYLLLLLAVAIAYSAFEYYRPKPLVRRITYANKDKIPFGTRALYELLPRTLGQPSVKTLRVPAFNHLTETKLPARSTYIAICETFGADANDRRALLRYVSQGNTVFISAYYFSDSLTINLGFRAKVQPLTLRDTTIVDNFTNPALRTPAGYNFREDDGRNYLIVKRPGTATVLGRNARQEPIFLKISHGKGFFYIHNLPLAFTNYYVMDPPTADYAFKALSYLPAQPTFWDEYQNQGRFDEEQQSIFRYIFTQPALTWAYYLVLAGLLLYALFAGKRTQRVIPVVEPPRNTSLEFAKTIGRLYSQQGDHDNLARKKIQYFLAHLRERYHLNTNNLDKEFTETLTRKSGAPADDVASLVQLIRAAQRNTMLSEYELISLNQAIENFNHQLER